MTETITFDHYTHDHDADDDGLERSLEALKEGRLPGRFGLLQDILGHWVVPAGKRTLLHTGKAILDTAGSILRYRDEQREVVDGGEQPVYRWLRENNYPFMKQGTPALGNFIRGALRDAPFHDKRVRDRKGKLAKQILKELKISDSVSIFCVDPCTSGSLALSSGEGKGEELWVGPYCREKDEGALRDFVRKLVWSRCPEPQTLTLSSDRNESIQLTADADRFDFASAGEEFNDVKSLAGRCQSYLTSGSSRAFLFHGPPGTGKSTLARAISKELGVRTVIVSSRAISHVSGVASLVVTLLDPGLVILNDVDRTIGSNVAVLLHALESAAKEPRVLVLTANVIGKLDPALLRPGRVHEVREVPEPNKESRAVILDYYCDSFSLNLSLEKREVVLSSTDGFSPADLREFAETARALGEDQAIEELGRIADQRKIYAGDQCKSFSDRGRPQPFRRRR